MALHLCCVPSCTRTQGDGVPSHRFPNIRKHDQIERFRTWVMKIGGPIVGEDDLFIHRNRRVCHRHFEEVYTFPNKRLTPFAIPSLNMPDVSLHDFPNPARFPQQYKRWVEIAGEFLKDSPPNVYRKRKVCHVHFTKKDRNRNNRLNALAVPSLNIPGSDNVVLHVFPNPNKDPERFRTWIRIISGGLLALDDDTIVRTRRVCDCHFEPQYHTRNKRLSNNAVPTLNLPGQLDFIDIVDVKSTKIKDVQLNSEDSKIFLIDHTYSLPDGPKSAANTRVTAKKDSVIDLDTRVGDTTVNVAINDTCDNVINDPCVNVFNEPCDDNALIDSCDDNGINDPCVDNANYEDDVVPNTPVIEIEISPQELFSWEKTDVIVADDKEMVEAPQLTLDLEDASMYNDEQPTEDHKTEGEFAEYRCNECGNKIKGFRYTCVQCADWDLCAACEARAAHDTHYVLRVPGQRPYKEMQAVLAAIRQQMLREDLFLPEIIASLKEEVKDEDAELPEGAPEVEDDPLAAWDISQQDDDFDTLQIYPERKDKDGRPPRKRRRTSLDSLDDIQNFTHREDPSYDNLATETDDALTELNRDGIRSNDGQTYNPSLDYSEPIEIIDIDKLINTQKQTEEHCKKNVNDTPERRKESCTEMSSDRYVSPRDGILDTCKSKVHHNQRVKLVDMSSLKTPLKTFKLSSHTQDDTHSVRKGTHSKQMGTDSKRIGIRNEGIERHSKETEAHSAGTPTISQTRKETDSKRTGTPSVAKTGAKVKKRYKILLPAGAQWKPLLMTMLKSRATVQVEDVMRKKKEHKKTEINEI